MNIIKYNKMYFIILYINLLLTLYILKLCYGIIGFNIVQITMFFVIGSLIYIFYSKILTKFRWRVLFTLFMISILAFFLYKTKLYIKVWNYYYNTLNSIILRLDNYKPTDFSEYTFILLIVLPIVVMLLLHIANSGLPNLVIILNLAMMISLWYLGYVDEIKDCLFIFAFLSVLSIAVNNYGKNIIKFKRRGYNVSYKEIGVFLLFLIPSVAIAVMVKLAPQNFQGKYNGNFSSDFSNAFITYGSENSNKNKYDLSYSGYGDESKLGGPIKDSNVLVFKVDSDKPLYLRGSVKDTYTGKSWISTKGNLQKENLDVNNIQNYLVQGSNEFSTVKIYPDYKTLETTTLFSPLGTREIKAGKFKVYQDKNITFSQNKVVKDPYEIMYVNYMYNADIFQKLFENRYFGGFNFGDHHIDKNKYENYLQLPNNISQRVIDLTHSITKGSNTSYEKIFKIKEYLLTNYKYSKDVSVVPDEEFVDYFLFTEKKGYCSYFATAMTVMCRIEGIPARYVEGFKMGDKRDETGLYQVTDKEAHAWCEALTIPEIDFWSIVEATPAQIIVPQANSNNTSIFPSSQQSSPQNKSIKENTDNSNLPTVNKKGMELTLIQKYIIGIFGALILIIIIIIVRYKIIRKKIVNSESYVEIYLYLKKRFREINIKNSNEGEMEYAQKIQDLKIKEFVISIATKACKEFYGYKKVTTKDGDKYLKTIDEYVKHRENKFKYYINKYIFID